MKCTINDINLSFDKDNRLRKTIYRVSKHDVDKAYVLASFFSDKNFIKFLLKNIKQTDILKGETVSFEELAKSDFAKINQNKLGDLLNLYYIEHYHSVHNSKTNKGMGNLNGFSTASAKTVAKNYNAQLIVEEYRKELNKTKKREPRQIIKAVNERLLNTLYERTTAFATHVLNSSEYSKEAKDYAQQYMDIIKSINSIIADNENDERFKASLEAILKERRAEFEEVTKQGKIAIKNKDVKSARSLSKRHENLREEIENLQNDIVATKKRLDDRKSNGELLMNKYVVAQNLINLYANKSDSVLGIRLRNFANLVAQTRGDVDAWYFQVFNTKKMTEIIKEFNKVEDIEEYLEEQDGNNDDVISKYNDQGIDETAKSWEDHLYNSFNQTITGKLKLILSSIPKLEQPYNANDKVQPIDTNNELGVPTFMDSQFLTVQVYSFGDFSSVDSLIRSIENKSKSIKALYGLGQLVNMMKSKKDFANFVYVNFAKPRIDKTILTIENLSDDNGISFEYSNPNAFPLTELVFRMTNKLKATYNSSYNDSDITKLTKIISNFNKNKNKDILNKDLFEVVTKYFSNFNKETFANYFDNIPDDKLTESATALVRSLSDIINGVKELKIRINSDEVNLTNKYNEEVKKYYEDLKTYNIAAGQPGVKVTKPKFPKRQYIDYSNYDLNSSIYSGIINFAKQIVNYTESRARLNTANANGNNASDIVKNCFITRFFEQIMAESEEDSNAGLKNLLAYIIQGAEKGKDNQYSNNPLFFGVKNENGVTIAPGMFTRTATGYEINPNAKEILKGNLFDGSKNTQDKNSATYAEMSKIDFFITQFISFRDSVSELTDRGKTKKIGNLDSAVYPMRIGSDAPKLYFIRAPKYNTNQVQYAFYNHVLDELNMFAKGLSSLFVKDNNGDFRLRKDTDGLIGRAFYNEKTVEKLKQEGATDFTSAFVEKGRLVGNLFKFNRLFKINQYNAGALIESMLSLYGGVDKTGLISSDESGNLKLVPNDIVIWNGSEFVIKLDNNHKQELLNIVKNWCNELLIDAKSRSTGFIKLLKDNKITYNDNLFNSFILNSVNMNMNYDDLFEGDYKYYTNARDFLKRTKESQAGGDGYAGYNLLDDPTKGIKELTWNDKKELIQVDSTTQFDENNSPVRENITINGRQLVARNGWRGVTIYNTNKASDYADQLQKELESIFISQGVPSNIAHERSVVIAKGYGFNAADKRGDTTKINDAQSYITLEEFIRRRHADGTIQDYADLIKVLTDDTPVEKIDLENINTRIQVQKNFYFDKVYDRDTGLFYPRQIKNAEFVLIPKLLPEGSELRKVHDWMVKNDIGQLNTAETSKAAKKSIFTIWDSVTGAFNENFEKGFTDDYVEKYKYQYLYKQQDVPQHLVDTKNKLGSQIAKKIIDNIINENDSNNPNRDRLIKLANEYQDAYSANIEEDFDRFLDSMNWGYDKETGKFFNTSYSTTDINGDELPKEIIEQNKYTLNFDNFYSRAREEAARLGMDSNFMEYLNPNEFGVPTMPNWMSIVTSKLESIAQSIYNSRITRQTLPGWHAAQITGVGYSKKLEFDPKTGVMQVYLPRWSNLIPKGKNTQEDAEILKQIESEGLDIHLGYRIPTEGKQSVAILKVVGFTNECLDSTIVVPDEWVTQTGSDFDVDSVYGISWEMYATKDKQGKISLHKIPFDENTTNDVDLYIKYVNDKLESKITRTDIGTEIQTSISNLKNELNSTNERKELNENFAEIDKERNDLYRTKLPNWARGIIVTNNKNPKFIQKGEDSKVDLRELYERINDELKDYLDKHNVDEETKEIVYQYIDSQIGLINIMNLQEGLPAFDKDIYLSKKAEVIEELVQKAKADYFEKVKETAKKADILDFEQFKELPFVKRLSRRARNNCIIDRMIKIMEDDTSREEQYGRSKFDAITNGKDGANDIIDKLYNPSSREPRERSPYNNLDQLDYFEDAMGGVRLKALSVNWDTFTSKNNKVRATLDESDAVQVILTVDGKSAEDSVITYNEESIKDSYKDDIIDYEETKKDIINKSTDDIKYFSSRKEMLNSMFNDADAFIGQVSQTPYIKQGNKFVLKNNTEVEKLINAISKRGVPKTRINELLSKESIEFLTDGKDLSSYYNVGYNTGDPNILVVTNRDLYSEGYIPNTILYLRDDNRLNEKIDDIQLHQFKNTSTFLVDNKDIIAIKFFKENGYKYIIYDVNKINNTSTSKNIKLSTIGYKKGDPQKNPNIDYVFTENAEAYVYYKNINLPSLKTNIPNTKNPKINVSDVNGTNQAGIRTDFNGNISDNAYGIIVKKYQQDANGYFVAKEGQFQDSDIDFNIFTKLNTNMFNELLKSKNDIIIFPTQIALGKAALPKRFVEWLKTELEHKFGVISEVEKNTRSDYEGYGLKLISIKNNANNVNTNNKTKKDNKRKVIFNARRLGWSDDNRNIVGELVTTYTSQTTAHHLDAVKMGSVPNVDEYTFNTYKFLSTLGIDFENVIAFIRQPIITELVKNNNLINSVFFSTRNNPIRMTLADIASSLGLKDGEHNITHYTKTDNIFNVLKSDSRFNSAFEELFGIDLSSMDNQSILNIKLPLDKERMFTRIKRKANNSGDVYENAAFDLGMLLTFRNIQTSANKVNKLVSTSNADKIGAPASIREARNLIKQINELRADMTLSKNGISFTDLIYPTINGNNELIDIEKSEYKSIASVYQYVTLASAQTNTKLFKMENTDFAISEDIIQKTIKHKFTEAEYKEYKRYAVATLYNQVQKLLTPLTINDRGIIIPDDKRIEDIKNNKNDVNVYWDEERSRIYGYGISTDGIFEPDNLNEPTEDDIYRFNQLSPAQKVLFIQKHFPDDQGIFNYIKVTLFNNTDIKYKGITRQYLAYDDQVDNIEDLFELFIKSFANHNKFIKLATVDLIKYAFIAEGFNFKSSYISKIIPNSVLYTSERDGGLDIINNLDAANSLTIMIDNLAYQMRSEEFIENFIRSHSEMIRTAKLNSWEKETDKFKSIMRADALVHIDATIDNDLLTNLISRLGIINNEDGFIRVTFPINDNKLETVLFKVKTSNEIFDKKGHVIGYKDYFLVPLNLLDKYETYDYSYNKNYNIFNSRDYYDTIVDELTRSVESARFDKVEDPREKANKEIKAKVEPIGAYTVNDVNLFENEYGLIELYEHGDDYVKGEIKRLMDGITSHIENIENGLNEPYIQFNMSFRLNKLIPKDARVVQMIPLSDGSQISVTIEHMKITPRIIKTIDSISTEFISNEDDNIEMKHFKNAVANMNSSKTLPAHANFYRVVRTKESKEASESKALKAATELIIDVNEDFGTDVKLANRRSKIDIVSSSIINEISYDARKNNTKMASRFVEELRRHGVNKHMGSTITNNRENIYKAAARYYRTAANSIINKLNGFTIAGSKYSMDEEAMYEDLLKHDEYFGEIAKIILDGITFGNRIADIFKLDISAEDKETKDAIETIISSINSVRQNKKLMDAMNNIINIYFKKYSTNPEIRRDILKLRETFGDLDVVDAWIADPADIDNNEVQVIIKQVYSMFAKAEIFDAKQNVKEFKDRVAKIEAMRDNMDINNVIDFENFKIKPEYNDEFLKDRQKLYDALNEAKENKDNSLDDFAKYVKAKYELDKFLYENTEQHIIGDYYKEDLRLRDTVMRKAGDVYIKYLKLTNDLYNLNKVSEENNNEITIKKRRIIDELSQLRSELDIVGGEKSEEDAAKARALNEFISGRYNLQDKYFNSKEYDGFQENYERYKKYIEEYDKRKPYDSLELKLENAQYKEAYDWIATNGKVMFGKEESRKLKEAFNKLKGYGTVLSKETMKKLRTVPEIIDDAGNIDATKLNDAQIKQLKEEEETELVEIYENTGGEIILIKDIPANIPMMLKNSPVKKKDDELTAAKFDIIGKINKIISKTVDRFTGSINVAAIFDNNIVSNDEREELIRLYKELKRLDDLNNNFTPSSKFKPKYTEEINQPAYFNAMNYYRTNLQNTIQGKQFLNIFTTIDKKGNIVANPYIYGYRKPTDDNIDQERTEARDYIKDNVEFVTTKYYDIAKHQAEEQGEEAFNEWFNNNHIYNPYTHRYEPLKVWTKLEGKPGSALASSIKYTPTFENMERTIKDKYINNPENRKRLGLDGDGYKKFGTNYKKGNSKYDSGIVLTPKEEALRDLLVQTMNKYATTYQGKRFVGQGYLPREKQAEMTTKWMLGQVGALAGLNWYSGVESDDFYDKVDYTHDREATMNMLALIKDKGSKDYLSIPEETDFDNEEEYKKEVARIREENKKIKQENEAIDRKNINKDWKEVMENFIHNATIFNSRQAAKPYLYLLLEDLAVNNAYMIKGMWNKSLVKDYDKSTDDDMIYKTIPQTRTRELVHTLVRRLLFEQHHKKSTPRAIANFLQNMTSAKYMVFNLYGGIANITTGLSNVIMESVANEYFGNSEFAKASNQYLANSVNMLANMYSDTAPNKTIAFIKEFNVVNFDQVLQFAEGANAVDVNLKRARNWLYSFQSVGEHYMQNSVLLAMLNSNRLYTDKDGVTRIGDFEDFTWDIEKQAMEEVLSSNKYLHDHYKLYLESIKYDIKEKLDLDSGRKDFNRNYLYSLRDSSNKSVQDAYKKIAEAYHKKRDELLENAKNEFVKNRTVESIFKFNESTGTLELDKEVVANFKQSDASIGDLKHLVGEFKVKVEKVNQKIHGVYDKISAAQLESKWFGSIIMQYHKHLYTGIFKRWRRKGYYSEFRGSKERGSYQTLIDFLGTEFTNFNARVKNKTNNNENVVLASLQVTMQSLINTFVNIQFNYKNLSPWERANINRYKSELVGPLVACLIVMALYGLNDDDDIKDDTFKASLLYLADRLYSDTTMYNPMGLVTEAKTAWSSPIASANGPSDLLKSMQLITQSLFDPDYNPKYQSGQYAGKNKLSVLFRRNIPGLRPYDRIQFITKNNKYYKVGETQIGINIAKNLGEAMNE